MNPDTLPKYLHEWEFSWTRLMLGFSYEQDQLIIFLGPWSFILFRDRGDFQ
jgi:hypothetical protein